MLDIHTEFRFIDRFLTSKAKRDEKDTKLAYDLIVEITRNEPVCDKYLKAEIPIKTAIAKLSREK